MRLPLLRPVLAMALVLACVPAAAVVQGDRKYADGYVVAAVREYTMSAEEGNVEAQRKLARIYERGAYASPRQQVAADLEKALYWWEKAAATGDEKALRSLAALHVIGLGVPVDYGKALALYKRGNMDPGPELEARLFPDATDRRDMEMWVLAFRTYFARELSYPRESVRQGELGTVRMIFSPSAGTLKLVTSGEELPGLREAVTAAVRRALALAPIRAALLKYPFTIEIPVDFKIEGY